MGASTHPRPRLGWHFIEPLEARVLFSVELATWSDQFVDSIGINLHSAAYGGIYGNPTQMLADLNQIGIRHVRAPGASIPSGLKGVVMIDPQVVSGGQVNTSPSAITSALASIKSTYSAGVIDAIEGPNEYDANHSGDPNWTATITSFNNEVKRQMRADSWFNGIPYIGASLADGVQYQSVGNQSAGVDGSNIHDYPGNGNSPTSVIAPALAQANGYETDGMPAWTTETGYRTGSGTLSNQVTTTVQGRYYPRLFLDNYNAGMVRTYSFQLGDNNTDGTDYGNSGILDINGNFKPAATALQNTITVLKDPQGSSFTAGGLDYTISGAAGDVKHTLLEKANGTFELVLWREINSADALASASNATLTFTTLVGTSVTQYTPNVGTSGTALTVSNNAVTVGVTDQVTIIQITPASTPAAPAAPSGLTVNNNNSTRFSILNWTNNATNQDGFVIQRQNPDGKWYNAGATIGGTTSFTDRYLFEGKTYNYRIAAVNRGGASAFVSTGYTAPLGARVVDPLNNFSKTTAGPATPAKWAISGSATIQDEYDPGVAYSTSAPADLIWHYSGISSFKAIEYLGSGTASNTVLMAASPDGANWTLVPVNYTRSMTVAGYNSDVEFLEPAAPLPFGTNYIKLQNVANGPSLGEMEIWYQAGTVQVDLSSSFNRAGIYADGATFPGTGGMDTFGAALSANQLSPAVNWNGASFIMGPTGANNAVVASGQTITLPAGQYAALELAGLAVNGSQANQTFTVTYTDNTTQTFTQGISDWAIPQNYSGESIAASTNHRNLSGGGQDTTAVKVYGYSFALNPAKTVQSLTLPNNQKIILLAADLRTTAVNLGGFASDGDIGSPGSAGSATYDGASYTIQGGGADIWGASDSFNFLRKSASSDATMIARVTSLTNTDPWTKAGVMFRDSAAAGSMFAAILATPGHGVEFEYRTSTGGAAQGIAVSVPAPTPAAPVWVKLVRAGNAFSGYYSTDGVTYTQVSTTATVAINTTALAGLAVTAHNNSFLATATIDAVSLAGATQVNLASTYNRTGIYTDGSTFSSSGGADGGGDALPANLTGSSLTWNNASYAIGPAGANDMVAAAGQVISLPTGSYSTLSLIGFGVNGNQAGQSFKVTYTDGSTATFTQGVSDWFSPQGYAGEAAAATYSYRNVYNGTKSTATYNVYGYSFALDPTKTVASLTLPNNGNVVLLAINLVP